MLNARLAPRWAIALTVLLSGARLAAAEPIPLPPGAQAVEVAPSMRINGVPTRIRSFEVELPLAAVERHYRRWLGTPRVDTRIGGWTVLGRMQSAQLQTIRLRAAGADATIGTLSESALADTSATRRRSDFTPPSDGLAALDVEMTDPGRDARFLVWQSPRSLDASARQLRSALKARGYRLEHRLPVQEGNQRGIGLWFRSAQGEATAILTASPGATSVSLSIVQSPSSTPQ